MSEITQRTKSKMDYKPAEGYTVGPLLYPEFGYYLYYDYYDVDMNSTNDEHISGLLYEIHDFERPVYIYVWCALVILIFISNVFVLLVLMRRSMRSSHNVIFSAISVSDTLSCLVAMPVIVHIYGSENPVSGDVTLHGDWCYNYYLLKFYFERTFLTMSIWLTVLLGFNSWLTTVSPFHAKRVCTITKTIVMIAIVTCLSFVLHVYTLVQISGDFNGDAGRCAWRSDRSCKEGCVYVWLLFILMYLGPCILVMLIVSMLAKFFSNKNRINSNSTNTTVSLREHEGDNTRELIVVTIVIIVFLVPHVPYILYTLLLIVQTQMVETLILSLKTSRIFHCFYYTALALTFHSKFWIILAIDEKFRDTLRRMLLPRTPAYANRQPVPEYVSDQSGSTIPTPLKQCDSFDIPPSSEPTILDKKL